MLLNTGGKLVVADWFKAEELLDAQIEADIKPIEGEARLETVLAKILTVQRRNASPWIEHSVRVRRLRKAGWASCLLKAFRYQQRCF